MISLWLYISALLPKARDSNCIRQVFWLDSLFTFPCEQWFAVRGFLNNQTVITATGIAPECNRTSLLMNVVVATFNLYTVAKIPKSFDQHN